MPHYLVAYGHRNDGSPIAIRHAKTSTKEEAAKQCYGLVDMQRMTFAILPKLPRNMSLIARSKIEFQLESEHKAKKNVNKARKELLRRSVEFGCKELDKKIPDWAQKIDLENFDITDGRCIAGQLQKIGYDDLDEMSQEMGFYFPYHWDNRKELWDFLQELWVEELRKRQNTELKKLEQSLDWEDE